MTHSSFQGPPARVAGHASHPTQDETGRQILSAGLRRGPACRADIPHVGKSNCECAAPPTHRRSFVGGSAAPMPHFPRHRGTLFPGVLEDNRRRHLGCITQPLFFDSHPGLVELYGSQACLISLHRNEPGSHAMQDCAESLGFAASIVGVRHPSRMESVDGKVRSPINSKLSGA